MLPNFLVIGAAKSGTTSLWGYLDAHPDVFMSQKKELNFFCDPGWKQKLDRYEEQFEAATQPRRGEASVYYSMHPFKPGVAPRVYELLPDAKLIYLVRDPVPRAISGYVQNVAVGYEDRPIDEAFADLDDPANEYVCSSRYASQVKQYLELFDRDRIWIGEQADLLNDRAGTLRSIFEFLDIDADFASDRFDELVNVRSRQMRPTQLGYKLRVSKPAMLIRRLPAPIGTPLANLARNIFYRRIEQNPGLDPVLRAGFLERIRPEVAELEEIAGRRFDNWTLS